VYNEPTFSNSDFTSASFLWDLLWKGLLSKASKFGSPLPRIQNMKNANMVIQRTINTVLFQLFFFLIHSHEYGRLRAIKSILCQRKYLKVDIFIIEHF